MPGPFGIAPQLEEDSMSRVVRRSGIACLLLVLVSLPVSSLSQAPDGIAKKYTRDAGIAGDPDVVFTEMFEDSSVPSILSRWTNAGNAAGMSVTSDVPAESGGTRSLLMTAVGGATTGAQLYKKLTPGQDQLYLRYYVKYASGGTYHHAGGWMGGYNPPTDWPQGGANEKPTGSDRFTIGPEPANAALQFDLYTYWMNMRASPTGDFWGNTFVQNPAVTARTNRWMCVEVMVKMNNPTSASNGELALWIDGVQIIHLREGSPLGRWAGNIFTPDPSGSPFEGFRWRSVDQLNLNWIWLLYYTTGDPQGFVGKMWFDHVVLAKRYIGPINTGSVTDIVPPAPPFNIRVP
jgi:hypothetical protein